LEKGYQLSMQEVQEEIGLETDTEDLEIQEHRGSTNTGLLLELTIAWL